MKVIKLNEGPTVKPATRKYSPTTQSIIDMRVDYDDAKTVEEKADIVAKAFDSFTTSSNPCGTRLREIFGDSFMIKFVEAFNWSEFKENNTFIKLMRSQAFKELFDPATVSTPNQKVRISDTDRSFGGQTLSVREMFELLYNSYVHDELDNIDFNQISAEQLLIQCLSKGTQASINKQNQQFVNQMNNVFKNVKSGANVISQLDTQQQQNVAAALKQLNIT